MWPTTNLLALILCWLLLGLVASFWPELMIYWGGAGIALGFLSLFDLVVLAAKPFLSLDRKTPSRFALGVPVDVELTLTNRGFTRANLQIFDGVPSESEAETLPLKVVVRGRGYTTVSYPIQLMKRGRLDFGLAHVLRLSPFSTLELLDEDRATGIGQGLPKLRTGDPLLPTRSREYAGTNGHHQKEQTGGQPRIPSTP